MVLQRRVERWLVKLMEFNIKCVTQKVVKSQASVEFLASHSTWPKEGKLKQVVKVTSVGKPPLWTLFFDGARVGQ